MTSNPRAVQQPHYTPLKQLLFAEQYVRGYYYEYDDDAQQQLAVAACWYETRPGPAATTTSTRTGKKSLFAIPDESVWTRC
jgi:hypothetical protein